MTEAFIVEDVKDNPTQSGEIVIAIPEKQKWFGELSKSKWGIYKRTQSFLKELNCQNRNNQYVIESLHSICLEDLWLYNSLEDSEKALTVLVDIFKELFASEITPEQRELLVITLLEFVDHLAVLSDFPEKVISQCFAIIEQDIKRHEAQYVTTSGYFKTYLNKIAQIPTFKPIVETLTSYLVDKCIDYWEETSKAEEWFSSNRHLFHSIDEETIKEIGYPFFNRLRAERKNAAGWETLRHLMFYNDIANYFRSFTDKFNSSLEAIYYLFFLMHLPGMAKFREFLLYDINRNLRKVIKEIYTEDIIDFIEMAMREFNQFKESQPIIVLDCLATLGKEVINAKDKNSISYFIKSLIKLGFNYPGELNLNSDWQIQVNANHIKNIRVWLELIEQNPGAMKELIAALIVNLKQGGIFISDTDLFQRDVTKLLNSDIKPVYREIKQLARIFPVYFCDIGAEGKLREATIAIDQLSMRKDRLIHFLRVQIHTESNNTHIELLRKIIGYWYDGRKEPLQGLIPDDIYAALDTEDDCYLGVHEVMLRLFKELKQRPEQLIQVDMGRIKVTLNSITAGSSRDRSRVLLIFQIYSLILEKYSLESEDIIPIIKNFGFFSLDDVTALKKDLEDGLNEDAIKKIYKMMKHLKAIILDPKASNAYENIYYKRHIAFGIPSMYGQYREQKFEALGLMYRLEKIVSKLMVKVLQPFSSEYITAKTLHQAYKVLLLFKDGLELDGIYNQGFNSHLDMFKYSLASPSFSLKQYINIFQFMAQDIKQIINEYFIDVYKRPLSIIIPQILRLKNLPAGENRQLLQMETEKFLRDNLSSAFLIQDLDNFITSKINTFRNLIENYSHVFIENMLTYNPDLTFSLLTQKTEKVDNPVFLGAKAFMLKKIATYNFPVPPGFVITAEAYRHKDIITGHYYVRQDFDRMIAENIKIIEKITGRKYGDPQKPLLFSVRSGSFISFPGAMKTFLNVGMNDEIAEAFSRVKGLGWTAWDCYRRFLQSWGMAFGIDRDTFDKVMAEHKIRYGVELKRQFAEEHMREIAFAYKKILEDYDIKIASEPFEQLKQAIQCVWDSWSCASSVSYRSHMQIADEWGTAVLVQKMVLGNLSSHSGTGVLFTSNPFNGYSEINLYGDFAICSQGEDVVAGLVNTLPISEYQRKNYYQDCSLSLESGFPRIYEALLHYARQLIERHGFVHQEIEFTFESDDPNSLFILQTRNQKLKKQESYSRFVRPQNEMKLIGHGIGVSSGVLSGLLAFDMEDIKSLKEDKPEAKIILVRPDTVPDDIPMIFACDGLITAKGGITSHAAVTAASLGKVCIVKCSSLNVKESEKTCTINGHVFLPGDSISIDGSLGNIYEGCYEIS